MLTHGSLKGTLARGFYSLSFRIRAALVDFFRALPGWFYARYRWELLLVPAVCAAAVYQLADANVLGWGDSATNKSLMEIAHPGLLASSAFAALLGWVLTWDTSLAFLCVMCSLFLAREIGGQGTSFVPYTGLLILITYGHSNQPKLRTLLHSRLACSFLATCFIAYAISQLLDRGAIQRLGWLFTWDTSWRVPHSSQMEESLETLGGSFLLLAVTYVAAKARRLSSGQK